MSSEESDLRDGHRVMVRVDDNLWDFVRAIAKEEPEEEPYPFRDDGENVSVCYIIRTSTDLLMVAYCKREQEYLETLEQDAITAKHWFVVPREKIWPHIRQSVRDHLWKDYGWRVPEEIRNA